jgi:hypothetical protein
LRDNPCDQTKVIPKQLNVSNWGDEEEKRKKEDWGDKLFLSFYIRKLLFLFISFSYTFLSLFIVWRGKKWQKKKTYLSSANVIVIHKRNRVQYIGGESENTRIVHRG